ncbi:MAG: 2Fe-2S iron-sulfur cluster-binding protein [Parasphingorhabdus sp.]|uniref:2Fe-2S iron-sulfur cluster-binding protein n=1 Tax=Parasphingorhabdus sp. TaxID=2709688 RepID=UPI003002C520
MPKITFVTEDGHEQVVDAPVGTSAMEAALNNGVPGIDGDCCGAVACGTCHVYVDQKWFDKTGPMTPGDETEMLELTDALRDNSRLSCQIVMTDELDGLILTTPGHQH